MYIQNAFMSDFMKMYSEYNDEALFVPAVDSELSITLQLHSHHKDLRLIGIYMSCNMY